MKRVVLLSVVLSLMLLNLNLNIVHSAEIQIKVNDRTIDFQTIRPMFKNGSLFSPARELTESMDGEISWDGNLKQVTLNFNATNIVFKIGINQCEVTNGSNKNEIQLAAAPVIINGKAMLPVRAIVENIGGSINWDSKNLLADITYPKDIAKDTKYLYNDVLQLEGKTKLRLDLSLKEILTIMGQPSRIDESTYNFKWYVYNNDYANYVQIGIDEKDKVVAIYTNAKNFNVNGITSKSSLNDIKKLYQVDYPLGNVINRYEGDKNLLYYMDQTDNKVNGVLIIKKGLKKTNKTDTDSLESQTMDIINAERIKKDMLVLTTGKSYNKYAKLKSQDMADLSELSYESSPEMSMVNRISASGAYQIKVVAENISRGKKEAFEVVNNWINEYNERNNIFDPSMEKIGVGVSESNDIYGFYYAVGFFSL